MLKLFVIILVSALCGGVRTNIVSNNDNNNTSREARDYYYPSDQENKNNYNNYYSDYPPLTHPSNNYIPYKEADLPTAAPQCPPSPLVPILNNALQFILLKLGAIGIVKALFATIFVILLFKLPILLAKAAFVKMFLLPIIMGPLMLLFPGMFGNGMMMMPAMPSMPSMTPMTPATSPQPANATSRLARLFSEDEQTFFSNTWQGAKMILDSGKCVERMACQIGAWNNDGPSGHALTRMVKHLEISSPSNARFRIQSLREAFADGNKNGTCDYEEYPCETPELVINQGNQTMRVL